jgi:hypothetical protein
VATLLRHQRKFILSSNSSSLFSERNCTFFLFFPNSNYTVNVTIQVILCANSKPALNDVTYSELVLLLEQAALISKDLSCALEEGRLWVMDSGQASPCLDLG